MASTSKTHGLAYLAAATTTGVIVGALITLSLTKKWSSGGEKRRSSRRSHQTSNDPTQSPRDGDPSSSPSNLPWEIRQEQLSRHTLFFGPDGMERLRGARVCVVGAGGVGSHTVCSLIRAGVGYLRVIDFDQVSLSSLNRHACATLAHVGTPKTSCLVEYGHQLCPDERYLQVDGRCEMYTAETSQHLLDLAIGSESASSSSDPPKWDWIIDAIDDVPTKAHLIYAAWTMNVRVVSCMGAGGKADFTRLHVSDLQSASRDPLATKLRQCLKKLIATTTKSQTASTTDNNVTTTDQYDDLFQNATRLAIVFSSEKPVAKLANLTVEQERVKQNESDSSSPSETTSLANEYGAVAGMRIRVLPVLGTLPAIMGQVRETT